MDIFAVGSFCLANGKADFLKIRLIFYVVEEFVNKMVGLVLSFKLPKQIGKLE